MVDFEAAEHGEFRMCYWRRRDGRGALRSYLRHWRRKHWYPFVTGTHVILDEVARWSRPDARPLDDLREIGR